MTDWPRRAVRPTPAGPLSVKHQRKVSADMRARMRRRATLICRWNRNVASCSCCRDSCPAVARAGELYVRSASVTQGRAALISISFQEGALTEPEALVRPTVSVSSVRQGRRSTTRRPPMGRRCCNQNDATNDNGPARQWQ